MEERLRKQRYSSPSPHIGNQTQKLFKKNSGDNLYNVKCSLQMLTTQFKDKVKSQKAQYEEQLEAQKREFQL